MCGIWVKAGGSCPIPKTFFEFPTQDEESLRLCGQLMSLYQLSSSTQLVTLVYRLLGGCIGWGVGHLGRLFQCQPILVLIIMVEERKAVVTSITLMF